MKRLIFCVVFFGVALGVSTAQAAINWDEDFTTFRYDVNKNGGGMLVYPPSLYFSTAQDTDLFYYDVSQGRTDPYNSTASGDLTEFAGASIPGEIQMTAMAKGPAGGSSPSDGLEVQAFTKVALSDLNAHCLNVTQEAITWVNRQFSVSSEEEYILEASLSGLVNFAAFGTPPYAATYSLSGEVKLTEIVGTWPNETFTQVAVLPVSESTRQGSVQITLVNQKGGDPVRYELRAFLTLQTHLINFALPDLTPIALFPEPVYKLGDETAPFVLRATVGTTPTQAALKDEIVSNYGTTYGLWHYDQPGGWSQLNTVAPGQMTALNIDSDTQEELAVTFSGYGLWIYDPTTGWSQLNTVVPDAMIRLNNGLAVDYGVHGLWSWTQAGGWQQWNTVDPGQMVAVDIDNDTVEELAVTFSGYGLWIYDPTTGWSQLNTSVPDAMIRLNNGLAVDYGVYGLWSWTQAGGWQQLNTVDPGQMVAVDIDNDTVEELAVTFSGYGLWIYDPTTGWSQLNTVVPDAMIRLNNGLAVDYGVYGLWSWTQAGGWQQWNTVDPGQMVAVDIDNDTVEELAVTFSGYGLWIYDPTTGWSQLNTSVPDAMAPANLLN